MELLKHLMKRVNAGDRVKTELAKGYNQAMKENGELHSEVTRLLNSFSELSKLFSDYVDTKVVEVQKLQKECNVYRDALRFYAEENHYRHPDGVTGLAVIKDNGKTAKEAMKIGESYPTPD